MVINCKNRDNLGRSLFVFPGIGDTIKPGAPGFSLVRRWLMLLALAVIMGFVLVNIAVRFFPSRSPEVEPLWGSKPVLGYFVLTGSLADMLQRDLDLSADQFQVIREIALDEAAQIRALQAESLHIIQDRELDLSEKRAAIKAMGYNERVLDIIGSSQRSLEGALSPLAHSGLENWITHRWLVERSLHGSPLKAAGPRTFRIFATRYDSGGSYTVALPDQCVKFSNAGNHVCAEDGYQVGWNYNVFLSYKGSTAAAVLESGPWNIDDNYWATLNDPTPRRMFADLPLGMPEAQAAYFNNYNGGVDQFGRVVTAPFGIDLARQVSIDIGLQPGTNDWIDVSFMWTEGWDGVGAPPPPDSDTTITPLPTVEVIIPVEVATPQPDGSIFHIVQQGQALLHIAKAYVVDLSELLTLNGLTLEAVIFPGDELLIKLADSTPTPTEGKLESSATATGKPSATPRASQTPAVDTPTPLAEALAAAGGPQTEVQAEGSPQEPSALAEFLAGVDPILLIIVVLVLAGTGLVLFGTLAKRKP